MENVKPSIFKCCNNCPQFLITYSVAGELKTYSVCKECLKLECFSKHIINKTPITNSISKKKSDGEFSDENDENEIIDGKFSERIEQNENLAEQNENEGHSQLDLKNKRSTKL